MINIRTEHRVRGSRVSGVRNRCLELWDVLGQAPRYPLPIPLFLYFFSLLLFIWAFRFIPQFSDLVELWNSLG